MSISTTHGSSSGDMRFHLQTLLDSKEKQLQQAGTLGQQLLAQRMELEERVGQLQEMDFDVGDGDEVREKYRELADIIKAWDAENEQLSNAFGLKLLNGTHSSPPVDIPRGEIERTVERSKASTSGTTAAQSSRRAKNAAHRADDVEFAFEIGSGLLTEVRRLQSLLAERDKAIQDMKEEKDDLEKTVESLRTALREQEQSSDKFKEENWNLEVTLQDLRTQLSDSQATVQRFEGEQKRLAKLLTTTRETADHHKGEAERQKNAFEELKHKHETAVAQFRREKASLQREKSDLQQEYDAERAKNAKISLRQHRFGSPLTPNGTTAPDFATPAHEEDDIFGATGGASTANRKKFDTSGLLPLDDFDFADESPDPSPSRPFLAPNHPSNELEVAQQRYAHLQRQLNTQSRALQREKEQKLEWKRKYDLLTSAQADDDEEEEEETIQQSSLEDSKPKTRLTPFRSSKGRARGRGRGGLTLLQRLAAHSPDYADEDDLPDVPNETGLPPVLRGSSPYHSDQEEDRADSTQSPLSRAALKRTSTDGMDPEFANVLRQSTSPRSLSRSASSLRRSVFSKSPRGKVLSRRPRGGAAYQEARPPSFAGEPEALASELSQLGFGDMEDTLELPEPVKTAEMGCQTDFEEPVLPAVIVTEPSNPVIPFTSEIGIQVDPAPVLLPAKSDMSLQTDVEVVLVRLEAGVQHEDQTPVPLLVTSHASSQTEWEPPVHSEAGVQHEDLTPSSSFVSAGMMTESELVLPPTTHAIPLGTFAQAEVQTSVVLSVDMDVQTIPEVVPSKADIDIQTLSTPSPMSIEEAIQTSSFAFSDVEVQVAGPSREASLADSSIGDSSGEATVMLHHTSVATEYIEDDGIRTETASIIETDTDDYMDARQSMSLVTPTESFDDYHSIMTVTDNDFSESDDDGQSVKTSRVSSRQETPSSPIALPDPPTVPTYESKGVSAEFEAETISADQTTDDPKPDFKEMSIQTDDWTPDLLSHITPSSPVPPASPSVFRVGPSSQQFQFISPPPSTGPTLASLPTVAPPSPNAIARDSFIPRPRTSQSDRRQSIESTLSSAVDEIMLRSRTPSNVPSVVDKSRPPMMALPPPPRQPPPPNSMLPPPFIPDRRQPTVSSTSQDVPPPRPSSPPPVELIQRATTPTFGAVLSVPGANRTFGLRHHSSNVPTSVRQPPSTSSFRSAGVASRPPQSSPSALSFSIQERERREMSTTSLTSAGHSIGSQRSSVSSEHYDQPPRRLPDPPVTPDRSAGFSARQAAGGSTDPTVIHAITQTMIGEFLYKYTRRTIGKGHGEKRHKRFFWVHPYTRTLYWSSADPGSASVSESSAKSGRS
ncbi:hypothetical protein EW026_g5644 [Hermanssonia centrifuga]|uniref:Pleckstrin homology domain-containing protein n=1 Tax=Hermanssonia centrifuga TaxID=98765 RepID=A0A4S4KDH8_9APHY|nr:hypothetical protein EW026_g5644 [Hermanssonia centrifuga]